MFGVNHWNPIVSSDNLTTDRWLVFAGNGTVTNHLTSSLSSHHQDVITIYPGREYNEISQDLYAIDFDDEDHYIQLFNALKDDNGFAFDHILHCSSIDNKIDYDNLTSVELENLQTNGIMDFMEMSFLVYVMGIRSG